MTDNHEWQTAKYNMQDDMTQTPTPEQYDWARRALFKHNRWRLGADAPPTDPKELTEAIEIAMQALRFTAKALGEPSPKVLLEMMKFMDGKKLHDTYHDMIAEICKECAE